MSDHAQFTITPTEESAVTKTIVERPETAVTKTESNAGRPSKMDDEIVTKFIAAFQHGYTDTKACEYARVSRQWLYRHLKEDPEFRDKITDAKNFWVQLAGNNITKILQSQDPASEKTRAALSKWVYEKHMPDGYGSKTEGEEDPKTQNNFLFISYDKLRRITAAAGLKAADPSTLLEAFADADVDRGEAEDSTVELHP